MFLHDSLNKEKFNKNKKLNFINGMNIAHEIERTMARRRPSQNSALSCGAMVQHKTQSVTSYFKQR